MGLLRPFFSAEAEIVESRFTFNYVEFGRIKLGIENLLPSTQELDGVPVTKPVVKEQLRRRRLHLSILMDFPNDSDRSWVIGHHFDSTV